MIVTLWLEGWHSTIVNDNNNTEDCIKVIAAHCKKVKRHCDTVDNYWVIYKLKIIIIYKFLIF